MRCGTHLPAARWKSAVSDGDRLRITVADTGEGIAPEHLTRVFERFYRADSARDREHGGAGLGLAIAKALVEAHSGTISVASSGPGAGATFTIDLPTAPIRAEELPSYGCLNADLTIAPPTCYLSSIPCIVSISAC